MSGRYQLANPDVVDMARMWANYDLQRRQDPLLRAQAENEILRGKQMAFGLGQQQHAEALRRPIMDEMLKRELMESAKLNQINEAYGGGR